MGYGSCRGFTINVCSHALDKSTHQLGNGYNFQATLTFTANEAEPLGGSPALFCKTENLMRLHCPLVSSACVSVKKKISPSLQKSPFLHNTAHRVWFNLNELSLTDQIRHSRWAFIRKALSGQLFGHWWHRKYISKRALKSSNLGRIENLKVGCEGIKSYSECQG